MINATNLDSGLRRNDRGSIMEDSTKNSEQRSVQIVEEVVNSVTLARLVEEVRNEGADVTRNYDRPHSRHNR